MRTATLLLVVVAALSGCVRLPTSTVPTPANEPAQTDRQASAPPSYVVFGQRYYPMASADGYRERGVASWYGGKFHGRRTSNGETYDMHGMTAAHKTLPLSTWVRVTNLRNGKHVVLRVNDRGPFVKNRLIDLSYEAARQLDMLAAGTTLVEVEALDPDIEVAPVEAAAGLHSVPMPTVAAPVAEARPANATTAAAIAANEVTTPATADPSVITFVQVGAFGDLENAQRMKSTLYNAGISKVRIDVGEDPANLPVYRVQVGPVVDVAAYDALVEQLQVLGISDTYLVVFTP